MLRRVLALVLLVASLACSSSEPSAQGRHAPALGPPAQTCAERPGKVIGKDFEGRVSDLKGEGIADIGTAGCFWIAISRGTVDVGDHLAILRGKLPVALVEVWKLKPSGQEAGCCTQASTYPVALGDLVVRERPEHSEVRRGRRITITYDEVDLREIMDDIGRRVGRNIVVEPEQLHEKVTITLKEIPWRDAVDVIAKMARCEVEERGPILVINQD